MNAEKKEAADAALDRFRETYGAKHPNASEKLVKLREVLLTHFEYPAEHWVHLRSTNAIESSFATVRLRAKKTKGAGSRSAGLAMAYKLLEPRRAGSVLEKRFGIVRILTHQAHPNSTPTTIGGW